MISFDRHVCSDFEAALSREWLETNGLGGFACGTIAGANTRRYHGLVTAALNPPGGRVLLLSKLEETLVLGERRIDLSTNEYEGAIHPTGYLHLTSFHQHPFPTFTFEAEGIKIEKTLFMPYGSNAIQMEYRLLEAPAKIEPVLELRPLIAFRDYHSTTHANSSLDPAFQSESNLVCVQPYPRLPRMYFAHNAETVAAQGYWYHNFVFRVERERGLDFREDLFNPFVLTWNLNRQKTVVVIASTESRDVHSSESVRRNEITRRNNLAENLPNEDPLVRSLVLAADQYLVRRGDDWTVIAGYPWFTDWGRDAMIALPGLTLFTGRTEVARSILLNFARHTDMGMLPNRFLDSGETAEYNTVDAALWFFEAARAYAAVTQDYEFLRDELYPILVQMVDCHVKGTRYNIKMSENGLLSSGAPGTQLTWMDAKIGDWVVTPRSGKPVEIQALWYNALRIMEDLAGRFHDDDRRRLYSQVASMTRWTFNRLFWNSEKNCLYDVVNNSPSDASVRPNQIFAVSMHHSMLAEDRAKAVVGIVERELLTPVGLRTLSPSDHNYHPIYQGDQYSRDSAYHQGTVWPWLLGPFVKAYVQVNGGTDEARRRGRSFLNGIESHLTEAGVGQISEIFDAEPPHLPRGCFAQAWSVAEILRTLCEDM